MSITTVTEEEGSLTNESNQCNGIYDGSVQNGENSSDMCLPNLAAMLKQKHAENQVDPAQATVKCEYEPAGSTISHVEEQENDVLKDEKMTSSITIKEEMDLVAVALSHHSPPPFARRPPHSKWDRADRQGGRGGGERRDEQ